MSIDCAEFHKNFQTKRQILLNPFILTMFQMLGIMYRFSCHPLNLTKSSNLNTHRFPFYCFLVLNSYSIQQQPHLHSFLNHTYYWICNNSQYKRSEFAESFKSLERRQNGEWMMKYKQHIRLKQQRPAKEKNVRNSFKYKFVHESLELSINQVTIC